MTLDDDTRRVLRVLARGRSNRHHICQQSGLGDTDAERAIATLGTVELVIEVDRELYAITPDGLDALARDYPAEAGFLQETEVIHDAPAVKTIRMRGDRGHVEVQIDAESITTVADALREVLADTHGEHEAVSALDALVTADEGE